MKKAFLIAIIITFSSTLAIARQPERGYRGFVEWDNTFGPPDYNGEAHGI